MSNFGHVSSKDASAVDDLLSQAMDLYVLEQVAAINLSGFTDSALPTNLETRFRRLKSLPVSRQPDTVSSSKKLLSHSKSMAEKSRVTTSSSVAEKRNLSGRMKRVPSVNSALQSTGKTGSSSWRYSRDGEVLSPPTLKLFPREKSRSTSSALSSEPNQEERSNRKPKSKLSVSWFHKLSPSRAMGCFSYPSITSSNTIKSSKTGRKLTS